MVSLPTSALLLKLNDIRRLIGPESITIGLLHHVRCFKWCNFFVLQINQHSEHFSISELQIRQKIRGSFYAKPRIFHFHNGKNGWLNSINKSSEKNCLTVPVYCKLAWKATSIGNFPHNHDENKINRTRWKISRYTVKIEIINRKC